MYVLIHILQCQEQAMTPLSGAFPFAVTCRRLPDGVLLALVSGGLPKATLRERSGARSESRRRATRRNDRGHEQAIECSRSRAVGGVSGAAGEGDPEGAFPSRAARARPASRTERAKGPLRARSAAPRGAGPVAVTTAPTPLPPSGPGPRASRRRTRSPGGRTRAPRRASVDVQ